MAQGGTHAVAGQGRRHHRVGFGLGRECALLFAEEGARIVTSDLVAGRAQKVAKEVESAGGQAVGVDADVRSSRTWSAWCARPSTRSDGST